MPDKIVARSPMSDVERKIGLRPLEELIAERAALVERVADLRARWGAFGTGDYLRKCELARIAQLIRAQSSHAKIKLTAAEVDDAAHDHGDYRDFIAEATRQRAELFKAETAIEHIEWTIRRGEMIGRYITSEARL
jgi:hypothetical protein